MDVKLKTWVWDGGLNPDGDTMDWLDRIRFMGPSQSLERNPAQNFERNLPEMERFTRMAFSL